MSLMDDLIMARISIDSDILFIVVSLSRVANHSGYSTARTNHING